MTRTIRRLIVVAAVAGAAFVGYAALAGAQGSCPSQFACGWTGAHFTGSMNTYGAGTAGQPFHSIGTVDSGANRFDNKSVIFSNNGDGSGGRYCLWPGEDAHDWFTFTHASGIKILTAADGHCSGFPH